MVIRFPEHRRLPSGIAFAGQGEPGQVVILPVIRIERCEAPVTQNGNRRGNNRKRRRRASRS
jgi:hypothetical protein